MGSGDVGPHRQGFNFHDQFSSLKEELEDIHQKEEATWEKIQCKTTPYTVSNSIEDVPMQYNRKTGMPSITDAYPSDKPVMEDRYHCSLLQYHIDNNPRLSKLLQEVVSDPILEDCTPKDRNIMIAFQLYRLQHRILENAIDTIYYKTRSEVNDIQRRLDHLVRITKMNKNISRRSFERQPFSHPYSFRTKPTSFPPPYETQSTSYLGPFGMRSTFPPPYDTRSNSCPGPFEEALTTFPPPYDERSSSFPGSYERASTSFTKRYDTDLWRAHNDISPTSFPDSYRGQATSFSISCDSQLNTLNENTMLKYSNYCGKEIETEDSYPGRFGGEYDRQAHYNMFKNLNPAVNSDTFHDISNKFGCETSL